MNSHVPPTSITESNILQTLIKIWAFVKVYTDTFWLCLVLFTSSVKRAICSSNFLQLRFTEKF